MKKQHKDIVTQLALLRNISEEKAAQELAEWVESMLGIAAENLTCHVPGFGTFRKIDEKLEFVCDEILSMEINHKYAGFKPIDVSPAHLRNITGTEVPASDTPDKQPEMTDRLTSGSDENIRESDRELSEPDEKQQEANREMPQPDEKQQEADRDLSEQEEPQETRMSDMDRREQIEGDAPAEERIPGDGADDDRRLEEHLEIIDEGRKDIDDRQHEEDDELTNTIADDEPKKENSLVIWLIPAAAVLIVAILLYFHFEGQNLSMKLGLDDRVAEEQEQLSGTGNETAGVHELRQSEGLELPEPAGSPDERMAETPADRIPDLPEERAGDPFAEEPGDPFAGFTEDYEVLPYGLLGPESEVLIGSYTIVLHSIPSQGRARIEKQKLEEQGYKATLWRATLPNGNRTWRVGVGQFLTVPDAQEAVGRLPEPWRNNNFIIRIR